MGLPCFLIYRCLKVVKNRPVNPHLRCNYGCFYSIKKSASMPTPCNVKCARDSSLPLPFICQMTPQLKNSSLNICRNKEHSWTALTQVERMFNGPSHNVTFACRQHLAVLPLSSPAWIFFPLLMKVYFAYSNIHKA